MQTSDFDYDLPRELIATRPADRRDESRLMHLDRESGKIDHSQFSIIGELLRPGDLLVMNDSRVMKARLRGVRQTTGAAVEVLLLERVAASADPATADRPGDEWVAMCRPAKKFRIGEQINFGNGSLLARVIGEREDGERVLRFPMADVLPLLDLHGEIPLPPYIVQRRKELETGSDPDHREGAAGKPDFDDAGRYQTVYAVEPGSVAAPTAGLHFTQELLAQLTGHGVGLAWVTLHVGAGTFKPVEVDDPATHPMHSEQYEVPPTTAQAIARTRAAGGRVIAVGTTTVRTLESAWQAEGTDGAFKTGRQSTRLLILPGYKFQVVDAMITNFHLPKSSLLMMISAFAGHGNVMAAYAEAIRERYRFYSYGDAMFIG